jgi:hypothetical protein
MATLPESVGVLRARSANQGRQAVGGLWLRPGLPLLPAPNPTSSERYRTEAAAPHRRCRRMRAWLHNHGLSIGLCALWLALTAVSFVIDKSSVQNYIQNLTGDAFGAFIIVVATKYLVEKGSAESK